MNTENQNRRLPFTNSTLFMLPLFGLPKKDYDKAGFINCYIKDVVKEQEGDNILFLFEAKENKSELLEDITTMMDDMVVDMYGYKKKIIILVLRVPDEFKNDYKLILEGNYSELSDEYKETVSDNPNTSNKLYNDKVGKRLQLLIIEKNPLARSFVETEYDIDIEGANQVWSKFNQEDETLTIEKLEEILHNIGGVHEAEVI